MKNLEESKEITSDIYEEKFLSAPVGNKFENIIEEKDFVKHIDKLMAKSFIDNAQHGMFSALLQNSINFNVGGIYELRYSLLQNICEKMEEIGADNLVFTFAEVEPDNELLTMNPINNGNILYAVASLITGENISENDHNYLIISAKNEFELDSLKISYTDKERLRGLYVKYSHKILKDYFSINGKNTQSIYYHINDIKKTLEDEAECDVFKVYICEISDVEKVILEYNSSLTIKPEVYRKHFQFREKQMTLVFNSGDRYYDMGGLRP